jgi:hypothetical protein
MVFDMVFSLWAPIDGAGFKNNGIPDLFPEPATTLQIFRKPKFSESLWLD